MMIESRDMVIPDSRTLIPIVEVDQIPSGPSMLYASTPRLATLTIASPSIPTFPDTQVPTSTRTALSSTWPGTVRDLNIRRQHLLRVSLEIPAPNGTVIYGKFGMKMVTSGDGTRPVTNTTTIRAGSTFMIVPTVDTREFKTLRTRPATVSLPGRPSRQIAQRC